MLPKHIAIIMDGNGRWAKDRHKHRTFGHIKGAKVAREIIEHATHKGLQHLTLFAFSTENWKRPQAEVNLLMRLLKRHLARERQTLMKNNIRFRAIGHLNELPSEVQKEIHHNTEITSNNTGMELTFALNYGGQADIVQASQKIAQKVQAGDLQTHQITEELFAKHLWTYPTPNPDLLIRTSGEMRVSNFLLWQTAYSEMIFSKTNWPDFSAYHFNQSLAYFQQRNRRFGDVSFSENPDSSTISQSL